MNESNTCINDQNTDVAEACDTTSQEAAEAAVQDSAQTDPESPREEGAETDAMEKACEEAGVPDDPGADPDSDPDATDRTVEADGLDELRSELKSLREALASQTAQLNRTEREYGEFANLYPDVKLSEIPDSVWLDVEHGTPLAAAYALEERRRALLRAKAEESNQQNLLRTAGSCHGAPSGYFSPEEVRRMSQTDIRKHFSAILESMKTWK